MLSINMALKYLKNTSAKDVFIRVVPYMVYAEITPDLKMIKKAPLAILVASLSGPFTPDRFSDTAIKDLLNITDYGHAHDWSNGITLWAQKYVSRSEIADYNELTQRIMSIANEVVDYLDENAMYNQQPYWYYIHELVPLGKEMWPRI